MSLIHHIVSGHGTPAVVFVHGFGCSHEDWDAQVAHLSPRHQTVAVDLRGHGASSGQAGDCSIEQYGADVAAVMQAVALPPAVLVGHSMGCRVVAEAAAQASDLTAGVILVDGSQFPATMATVFKDRFATPQGYAATISGLFQDMFTPRSNPAVVASVVERAGRLPAAIGQKLLMDVVRYDVERFATVLAALCVPVMAIQTTFSNKQRQRRTMREGQTTPYLDMVRASQPSARIRVIANTGHFPQLDESQRTDALIAEFLAELPTR